MDAFDGRKPGLDHPDQIVGDLVLLEHVGREAQVGRRELAVDGLHVDDGHLGFPAAGLPGPDRPWS